MQIDATSGRASQPTDLSSHGRLLGIAPDGRTLAFATQKGVQLWDLQSQQDVATLDLRV